MPWKTTIPMEEIIRFVSLAQTDRFTIADLREQFSISRKTAYKHLERYADGGWAALTPRSHRPHCFSQRTAEKIEALIPGGAPVAPHVGAEEAPGCAGA